MLKQKFKSDRGSSLVEYAMLVVLIATIAVAAVGVLGGETKNSFDAAGVALGGGGWSTVHHNDYDRAGDDNYRGTYHHGCTDDDADNGLAAHDGYYFPSDHNNYSRRAWPVHRS